MSYRRVASHFAANRGRAVRPSPMRQNALSHGEWRSLVAHSAGGRAVAGSNPASPIPGRALRKRVFALRGAGAELSLGPRGTSFGTETGQEWGLSRMPAPLSSSLQMTRNALCASGAGCSGSSWRRVGPEPARAGGPRGTACGSPCTNAARDPATPVPYFAVDDMATARERVHEVGGSIVHPGERWAVLPRLSVLGRRKAVRRQRFQQGSLLPSPLPLPPAVPPTKGEPRWSSTTGN